MSNNHNTNNKDLYGVPLPHAQNHPSNHPNNLNHTFKHRIISTCRLLPRTRQRLLTFCTTSQFVHFLWRYDIGGIFLAYISALSSIILQVITFKILSKDKQSLLKAYLGSSIIPGIYGIFVITLIWNTLVTKWLIGTIILGLLSTIVTYYIGRIVGSWQK